jgi:magnesium transporter
MATQYDAPAVNQQILDSLKSDRPRRAARLVEKLHPVDRAALFEELEPNAQEIYLSVVGPAGLAELLEHLDAEARRLTAAGVPRSILARVLDQMTSDDAADVVQSLPDEEAQAVMAEMRTAGSLRPLLQYPAETAGGLMTRGYLEIRPEMTAGEAISLLRTIQPPGGEVYYYLYVISPKNQLIGVVNLRQLITADPSTPVTDLMTAEIISVLPGTDQEECARLLQRYRLRALPVVDSAGVLKGTITADDLVDVLTREATEDMYKMAGVGVKERALSPLRESLRRRIPHLVTNLATAFISGLTVGTFEGTISKAASLAVFMPIIAGHGGNTGTQVATIVVRSVALDELKKKDTLNLLAKEIGFGLIHGCLVGALTAALALALYQNPWLAGVVFFAMVGNVVVAGIVGSLTPLGLEAMGMDPALASAIYLTTFTDVIGFLMLLGAGTLLLAHLT